MAEEEVLAELEAVKKVYGEDCDVIKEYPLHLHVHLKPRTAEDSSQQFVEATIQMLAGLKYPEEPPKISIIDSKGLDEESQNRLVDSICEKASKLVSSSMVVALCEEAVSRLSSMNYPNGECMLCFKPFVGRDVSSNSSPCMKLRSCFHCFHCDCIIRWWKGQLNEVQIVKENKSPLSSSSRITQYQQGVQKATEENMGKCPVCHKIFLPKDMEYVPKLVWTGGHLER